MNVTVYCASSMGNDPTFEKAIIELGEYLGSHGHRLVYGASKAGLMASLAHAVKRSGGSISGVGLEMFQNSSGSYEGIDDLYVAKTFSERRNRMIELGDAFIAFPGGLGTLDEISEVLCLGHFYFTDKPIILYDLNDFYKGIRDFIDHADECGFMY
ncbi:MAG: TIGR00730 family Rossman fold protein, partial [Bacilli bacterium]|nr:TIGR00730 family Rossman fold protein [Bacilli bacterium]